ncbi:MAG: glycoside hydrolase family protein [Planctomycetota bacterium]|jgi:hypothetical protein
MGHTNLPKRIPVESDFCHRLQPLNRILELEGYNVWGCSAIDGPDGKVHLFFSRWPVESTWQGWLSHSEIAHAVADKPQGPYQVVDVALKGTGRNHWDSFTNHNPTIHKIADKYALLYMGNRKVGDFWQNTSTKRIGLAMADSLYGPWQRIGDRPLLDVSENPNDWDGYVTTNPALLIHPNGQFWLYYKSWNPKGKNLRMMGLAIADRIEGPYERGTENPIIDFSHYNAQVEDAYVFFEDGKFKMIMRDMGFFDEKVGLYFESDDGIHWADPQIAYHASDAYFDEPKIDPPLNRAGRFERPQILMRNGHPAYLFVGFRGGKYQTASGAVLKIRAVLPA